MNQYIQKALETYCDHSQTVIARQLAYTTLTNAGFTADDLQFVLKNGPDSLPIMFFAA
ncbi:hypothetical protein ACFO4O_12555 [Glaciecola siphonariae]|uniref:Uncharacterized protein n=1 Tax=Glaciecola siphonariae TaxID=521012 RepID=A0ABV9LYM9_9ALTE